MIDMDAIEHRVKNTSDGPLRTYVGSHGESIEVDYVYGGDGVFHETAKQDITDLLGEVRRLRDGIGKVATKLQGLGHTTPWEFGRELQRLTEGV